MHREDDQDVHAYSGSRGGISHSGFGIASFAIAVIVGLLDFAIVVVAGIVDFSSPYGEDDRSPLAAPVVLGICGSVFVSLIGLVIGIVGLIQSQRKRAFAVLGVVLCSLLIVGVGMLMLFGTFV